MSTFSSLNPATGAVVWTGPAADRGEVDLAVGRARAAATGWAGRPHAERETVLRAFAGLLADQRERIAAAISREVGKPAWEARTEVQSMIGKVELSIEAHARRCGEFRSGTAVTRFRPHGVVAVLGPFNFPGHLPNGHMVPALLAGNAVIFKPSERAPAVAELLGGIWRTAGLPAAVLQVVQGGRETGEALAAHPGIDGLFFTGSVRAGLALHRQFAATPERILALEMGGNNPLVVFGASNHRAAALIAVQSAFLTAGQRCTCARRLIIPTGAEGDALLAEMGAFIRTLRVGGPDERPEPFMGPVIAESVAHDLLAKQAAAVAGGANVLAELRHLRPGTGLVSPGVLDVTPWTSRGDEEWFGPLLQVVRVPDFDAAITEANRTEFGLAAGLLSDDPGRYRTFLERVRAGIVNWNQPLTGASSAAPFGGVRRSGNHRPSAYFAADYCSYPVASIEVPTLALPTTLPPGLGETAP